MQANSTARAKRGSYASPRQEERQRRILATARREITELGYAALTMQQLAQASSVSTKTLYNLYGSKDELLLAAVADLLGNLEQHSQVLSAAEGIPSLLAFTEVVSDQVVATPQYAEVMAQALFQTDSQHRLVDLLLGNTRKVAREALDHAAQAGELQDGVDPDSTAQLLAGHQWGLILMWNKGQIALRDLKRQAMRSQLLCLIPLCAGALQAQLQARLKLV
ncbi:MAG: TetR/AcrR family transcriptional regulator [Halieaceae bacterium]